MQNTSRHASKLVSRPGALAVAPDCGRRSGCGAPDGACRTFAELRRTLRAERISGFGTRLSARQGRAAVLRTTRGLSIAPHERRLQGRAGRLASDTGHRRQHRQLWRRCRRQYGELQQRRHLHGRSYRRRRDLWCEECRSRDVGRYGLGQVQRRGLGHVDRCRVRRIYRCRLRQWGRLPPSRCQSIASNPGPCCGAARGCGFGTDAEGPLSKSTVQRGQRVLR